MGEGEMRMYVCCLLPWFWPLRMYWHWKIRQWSELLRKDHPEVHVLSTNAWREGFYERMAIHNDGRLYNMVLRNDGEILWASDDKFKEQVQEKHMVRVAKEEIQTRVDEKQKLIEAAAEGYLDKPDASTTDNTAAVTGNAPQETNTADVERRPADATGAPSKGQG